MADHWVPFILPRVPTGTVGQRSAKATPCSNRPTVMPKKPFLGVEETLGVLGVVETAGRLLALELPPPPQSRLVKTAAPPKANKMTVTARRNLFPRNMVTSSKDSA